MSRRMQCAVLQWLASGLVPFLLVSAQDRDLDNDGLWDESTDGIDRDRDNDGIWDE